MNSPIWAQRCAYGPLQRRGDDDGLSGSSSSLTGCWLQAAGPADVTLGFMNAGGKSLKFVEICAVYMGTDSFSKGHCGCNTFKNPRVHEV